MPKKNASFDLVSHEETFLIVFLSVAPLQKEKTNISILSTKNINIIVTMAIHFNYLSLGVEKLHKF